MLFRSSLLTKIPGDRAAQLATLRAYFGYMWAHPGKQLLFMGGEYGQPSEWSEGDGLDWGVSWAPEHRGVQLTVRELNRQYGQTPALWSADHDPAGFTWLEGGAAQENLLAFVRHAAPGHDDGRDLVCLTHLSGVERQGYRLGVPAAGEWEVVLDTSEAAFAGAVEDTTEQDALLERRRAPVVEAEARPWHGQEHSVVLNVPVLSTLWLRPRQG